MNRQRALIVDDEPDIRELLEITLGRMKLDTRSARNVKEAREWLAREPFDLCLTDMRLPDGTGLDLVQHIQQRHPQVPVAMITAYGSLDTAINSLKAGAFDFLTKPVDLGRLRELVATALRIRAPEGEEPPVDSRLLGDSPPMKALRKQILKLSRSQAPVYISGESGSGKELVARLIHEQGPRAEKPFVPVNCGAIPSELMESEFFGHKKGSFTGAIEDKQGLFQAANGGTLFLDEVADLPLAMQVKLLRAIQEKAVRAGEAALLVAEELALHQFRRDRAAVHRHERPLRARPALVDHARDHFLAGAGLAVDIDRRLAARELLDLVAQRLHWRRFAEQAGVYRSLRGFAAAQAQGGGDQLAQAAEVHRFGEEVEGTGLEGVDRGVQAAVGGDHGDRYFGMALLDVLDQVQAGAIGQAHVGQAQVERLPGQPLAGFLDVAGAASVELHPPQGDLQEFADIGLVVDDQGSLPGAHVQLSLRG